MEGFCMFAVYSATRHDAAFVLTPDCLAPSIQAEQEFGPLQHRGAVDIDVDLLDAIAEHRHDHNLEFLVTDAHGRRYLNLLVERCGEAQPDGRASHPQPQ
jgi:hypothetical protein